MVEQINGTVCISRAALIERGLMTVDQIKWATRTGKLVPLRRACRGVAAMYAVSDLPPHVRRALCPAEERTPATFAQMIEPDAEAAQFFADYMFDDGRHLPAEAQARLSGAAAVMNAIVLRLEEHQSMRARAAVRPVYMKDFWVYVLEQLKALPAELTAEMPRSARRLDQKLKEYRAEGYAALISAKWSNQNATKVDRQSQQGDLLTAIIGQGNNFNNAQVCALYNNEARKMGWKTITAGAVREYRKEVTALTTASRLGVSALRNTLTMQVKRSRPTCPLLMWTLDGWTAEMLYQGRRETEGRSSATYSNRLTLEVVLDPMCNYPIGYAIGDHETPELVKAALRNAVEHSCELFGQMHRAYQIQCDNYAIKSLTPWYNAMSHILTPAKAHNAKAKVVEPYFNYLNREYLQYLPSWSGFGVTTDPLRQPNAERLNLMRHQFPDEAGCRRWITAMMETERKRKHDEYVSQYGNLKPEHTMLLSLENYLQWFGAETGRRSTLSGSGVRATIMGERREYECFDISFRDHVHEKWAIRYDPRDPRHVLAINEDGTLRYMMEQKYVQPMAIAEQTDEDRRQLKRVRDFNNELEGTIKDGFSKASGNAEDLIRSVHDGILERFCLVDDTGQHKDNRNAARIEGTAQLPAPDTDKKDEDDELLRLLRMF